MASITLVSGAPGGGKTTLSASLARRQPEGLHLLSDLFYGFPSRPIDPTRPESQHQNTVVMRALGRSAHAFAEGGYDVVLDGVIGPWFLPVLEPELTGPWPVSYVLLRVPEAVAVERVRARQRAGASAAVRKMVAAFDAVVGFERHQIDTMGSSPERVLEVAWQGLAKGRFRLGG